jgi:hypothetical protein
MRKLLFVTAALLLTTLAAEAQREPFGPFGAVTNLPSGGPYRAINHDPATGRTYSRDADYVVIRKKKMIRK